MNFIRRKRRDNNEIQNIVFDYAKYCVGGMNRYDRSDERWKMVRELRFCWLLGNGTDKIHVMQ